GTFYSIIIVIGHARPITKVLDRRKESSENGDGGNTNLQSGRALSFGDFDWKRARIAKRDRCDPASV
ncbi:MAG TPA: hypothetical protein VEM15_01105, partial [Thermodesulfobacteriota bacterium]|nr:hypothetical protein [Thermodesulfobacteriota bacterium]